MSDVEVLARVVSGALTDAEEWVKSAEVENIVEAILASPWLAARDVAARAEALEEAECRVRALPICHVMYDPDQPISKAGQRILRALRADDAGWMHSCGGRERWYPLGARCVACGRKFGDEH